MRALVLLMLTVAAAGDIPRSLSITGGLQLVRTVREIPEPVRVALFSSLHADDSYGVADPNDDWTASCITGPKNPLHQLVYAASIPPFWVVAFRYGGNAPGEALYVFRLSHDRVEKSWSDLRLPYAESSEAFVARLQGGDECFVSPPRISYYGEELKKCLRRGT